MTENRIPLPDLQITFCQRLAELRKSILLEALLATVSVSDIQEIDAQLNSLVVKKALQRVAGWGMRGEIIFPVPCILIQNPRLLGYYRLLLGFSQKEFYGREYGFAPFRAMEQKAALSASHTGSLSTLCRNLCRSAEHLVSGVDQLSERVVHDLTLLKLGPQLRGGILNEYGSLAAKSVFEIIKRIVLPNILSQSGQMIRIKNAAGRVVEINFASDPDIRICEILPSNRVRNLVAIEIKGGADRSNIHNRLGEAEKSHQKARKSGFVECWTMVKVSGLDLNLAKKESPSTDRFYDINALKEERLEEFSDFSDHLRSRLGISDLG